MSNTNKSESNLPADAKCEENDQVGSPNLIDRASHSNLLPDCGNPGKVRENPRCPGYPGKRTPQTAYHASQVNGQYKT